MSEWNICLLCCAFLSPIYHVGENCQPGNFMSYRGTSTATTSLAEKIVRSGLVF